MNKTQQIYTEYQKIQKIIKSAYNWDDYDSETQKWLGNYLSKTSNGHRKLYNSAETIRFVCQQWLDKWIANARIDKFNKVWMDLTWYWLKGQYKKRKRFIYMFYAIYQDMVAKLDDLDGGPDHPEPGMHVTGFGSR